MNQAVIERGQEADLLYNVARYDEAEEAYEALYRDLATAGPIDLFFSGKIALGLLLTRVESGQMQEAHALWTARPSDPMGEGIWAIEHGALSRADFMTYQMVSALLWSLAADDKPAASHAIDVIMASICAYARTDDAALLPIAIKNWKQFLMQLHGSPLDARAGAAVLAEQTRYGTDIALDGIDFPPPAAWSKP